MNNWLSRHRSNNNKPLTPSQLFAVLEKYQERVEAIVYCPRKGTPDIYNQLKRITLVTIHIVQDIVSSRNRNILVYLKSTERYISYIGSLRLSCELKTVTIVLAQKNNFRSLITRSRPKKFSKRCRKTLRTRYAFEEADSPKPLITWMFLSLGLLLRSTRWLAMWLSLLTS